MFEAPWTGCGVVTVREHGDFRIDARLYFCKSAASDSTSDPNKYPVSLIVSSESKDFEGETVLQDGLDWDYFLDNGWLKDEHFETFVDKDKNGQPITIMRPTTSAGIGRPTKVVRNVQTRSGKRGTQVDGYLYTQSKRAAEIINLLEAAAAAGDDGVVQASIEGKVTTRRGPGGKIIAKGSPRNVVLTLNGVNPDSAVSIGAFAKSLATAAMTVGTPAPTYEGGGTVAPLMRQDMGTPTRRSRSMKTKKRNAKEFLAALSDEQAKSAAKALGYDEDAEEKDDEGKDGDESFGKSLAAADQMLKSLVAITDHLADKGRIALLTSDNAVEGVEVLGMREMADVAASQQTMIKSMHATLVEQGEMLKSMHAYLRVPAMPKAKKTGETLERTDGQVEDGDVVELAVAEDMVNKSFAAAINAGDAARAAEIERFGRHLSARGPKVRILKAELTKVLGTPAAAA